MLQSAPPKPSPTQAEIETRVRDGYSLLGPLATLIRKQISMNLAHDELVGFGHEGLMSAARSFDPTRGVPFRAWATFRIRGAMLDGVRSLGRLSRRAHERLRSANSAYEVATGFCRDQASATDPTAANAQLGSYLASMATALTMGLVQSDTANASGESTDERPSPEELIAHRQLSDIAKRAVSMLPDSERTLIEKYYFEDRTLEEAAASLGLSKSWGSRLHARALNLLADAMRKASG